MKRLVLLGPPGVGKGTYGKLLSKRLDIPLVTLSDTIRRVLASGTNPKLTQEIGSYTSEGRLLPDDIVVDLIDTELRHEKCRNGYILDGFPRTLAQAISLDNCLGQNVDVALHLSLLKDEYLIRKLLGRRLCSRKGCFKTFNIAHVENSAEGVYMPAILPSNKSSTHCECGAPLLSRDDDTQDVISKRLEVFAKETKPLIKYYADKVASPLLEFTILRGLEDYPNLENAVLERLKHAKM